MKSVRIGIRGARVLAAMVGTALVGACARQGAPPGGPEDRRPPVVIRTEPDTFETITEPFRGPVVFRFDERISERPVRGTMDDAVLVSPRTGNVRVTHGRDKVEVTMGGGFRPGLVYRVRLLPVINDMFGNTLRAPVELVFSTGGEFTASAVAGLVWDRTTGNGMDNLTVDALGPDSITYLSRTDTGGIYAFRFLPPGAYRVTAFDDRNRSDSLDRMETQGSTTLSIAGPDTVLDLDFSVLEPDTSPAVLAKATLLDSMTVSLDFDDYLDPGVPSRSARVDISREGEGPEARIVPGVTASYHESEYRVRANAVADSFARIDSLAAAQAARVAAAARLAAPDSAASADSAQAADSLEAARRARERAADSAAVRDTTSGRDTVRIAEPPVVAAAPRHPLLPALPAGEGGGGAPRRGAGDSIPRAPDGTLLPGRRIVLRLSAPLVPGVKYDFKVENVTNLNGLPGGGGEASVTRPEPKDTTAAKDTIPADTMPAGTVPPDTMPHDTVAQPSDTLPPDTVRAFDSGLPTRDGTREGVGAHRRFFLPGRPW